MGRLVFTALLAGTACGLDFDAPIVTSDAAPEVRSLLLTEAPLRAAGGAAVSFALPADVSTPVVTQAVALSPRALVAAGIMRGTSEKDMESVCKRTSAALLSEAPDATATDRILGGPVYRECTAALAPIRTGQQASAVSLLNDCMTLVDKIVEKLGKPSGAGIVDNDALCHDVVIAMAPMPAPTTLAPAEELLMPKTRPQQEKIEVTVTESEDLRAIVAAMPQVCTETVSAVESGIKTEADALKLGTTVAPVCENTARKHLGAAVDADIVSAALQSWCHQLDAHLTDALQTGFLYALHPVEAQKKFSGPNPYATTTRRQFCQGFNEAVQKAKVSVTIQHASIPAVVAVSAPAVVPTLAVVVPSNDIPKAPWEVLSDNNAPPKAEVNAETIHSSMASDSVKHVSVASSPPPVVQSVAPTMAPQPTTTTSQQSATKPTSAEVADPGPGVGMLHLVQEVSAHAEWRSVCEQLISRLTSHEGSIMEEYAFGTKETPVGTQVLTFNAQDHTEIRGCSANLKVIAIEVGMLKQGVVGTAKPSLLSVKETITKGAASLLGSADQAQALIDSPWAEDACGDLAHSYLATRIAHPEMKAADFCPWYAKDLQSMQSSSDENSPQIQVADDVTLLRRRHAQKSKLRVAEALSAHSKGENALSQVSPRTPTALIRGAARASSAKVVESERKVALAAQHVVVPASPVPSVAKKFAVSKPAPSAAEEATPEQEDTEGANLWQGMF